MQPDRIRIRNHYIEAVQDYPEFGPERGAKVPKELKPEGRIQRYMGDPGCARQHIQPHCTR